MKSKITILVSFCIFSIFMIVNLSPAAAQQQDGEWLPVFSTGDDGKLFTLNAAGQMVFTFSVSGLENEKDAGLFKTRFEGKEKVAMIIMGMPGEKGKGEVILVLNRYAQLSDLENLLKDAGVKSLSVDGTIKPVEALKAE